MGITVNVSGLTAGESVAFLLNGQDALTVTQNGIAGFTDANGGPTGLPPNTAYQITIAAQPSSQICTITGGSGTTGSSPPPAAQVSCGTAPATKAMQRRIPQLQSPVAREGAASWSDRSNDFYLFGGESVSTGAAQSLADFWRYSPLSSTWQPVPGTSSPGPRAYAALWVDVVGNVWLFGGIRETAAGPVYLSDLWELKAGTNDWLAITSSGPVPAARAGAVTWVGENGRLWLSGGRTYGSPVADLSDLWCFDPDTQSWTKQ